MIRALLLGGIGVTDRHQWPVMALLVGIPLALVILLELAL